MSNMSDGHFKPDAAVPQSLLTQVSTVLDNAHRALIEQRASIAALTAKNVELMVAVLDRNRKIAELHIEVNRLRDERGRDEETGQHERAAA